MHIEKLMMVPPGDISFIACWQEKYVPHVVRKMLIEYLLCHVRDRIVFMMPALLTEMSTRPNSSSALEMILET